MSEFTTNNVRVGEPPGSLDDLSWLNSYVFKSFGKSPASIKLKTLADAGGLTSDMKVITVSFEDQSNMSFVYKSLGGARSKTSRQVGLAREAFFYQNLAPTLHKAGVSLPIVLFAYGDFESGDKSLVLEDLSSGSIQSGQLFGPGSPLNWGKDLDALIAKSNVHGHEYSIKEVASKSFSMAAKLHATYWMDKSLFDFAWLRATDWYQQKGQDMWSGSQKLADSMWTAAKAKIAAGESTINWDPLLIACMDASFSKVNWENYQETIVSRQWTLVHGDFHPANMMWRWASKDSQGNDVASEPVLLDWEVVGVGIGPQDLSQYLISHVEPSVRREIEEDLVREYYAVLTGTSEVPSGDSPRKVVNSTEYTWDMCWHDYVTGGTERWVWLFGYLTGLCPDNMNQYFHDQLCAFMKDHNVTAENIGMPRV